jgi:hypothetical protein
MVSVSCSLLPLLPLLHLLPIYLNLNIYIIDNLDTDGPLELGTQLDVKSLTIVEPSSKTPLHIALLKGTTFSALHTLLLQFVTNGTYYHDASHGHGDNELLDDMGTDALVMDILSRVGAVTIELRTSAAINIILARCKAHLAVAYRRNVVKLHILEGQCQDYEAITM